MAVTTTIKKKKATTTKTRVTKPIPITKTAFDKDALDSINLALGGLQETVSSLGKTTDLRMVMLESRINKLERPRTQSTSVFGDLGNKTGRLAGGLCNTPIHPVASVSVFSEAMSTFWQNFKDGFKSTEQDFKKAVTKSKTA